MTKHLLIPVEIVEREIPFKGENTTGISVNLPNEGIVSTTLMLVQNETLASLSGERPVTLTAFLIACQNILGDALCDVLVKQAGGHTTALKAAVHKAFMDGGSYEDIAAIRAAQRMLDKDGMFTWAPEPGVRA